MHTPLESVNLLKLQLASLTVVVVVPAAVVIVVVDNVVTGRLVK